MCIRKENLTKALALIFYIINTQVLQFYLTGRYCGRMFSTFGPVGHKWWASASAH